MKFKVVIFSALDIWSMKEGVGAPSFYNTIKLYIDKGHEVVLIKPSSAKRNDIKIPGLNIISYNNFVLEELNRIKFVSFFSRIIHAERMFLAFYKYGKKVIENSDQVCLLYAYEVHAVKAAKKLSKMYNLPLITRFQGTVLHGIRNTLLNRIKKYPNFSALSEESDMVIMTDDGTFGDRVLKSLNNRTKQILFWKNGVDEINCELSQQLCVELKKKLSVESSSILLTVSRLAHWKRVDRAICAMADIIQSIPNCTLLIIGDGDARNEWERLVEDKQLQNHVIFIGVVSHDKLPLYYQIADVFLSLYDIGNVGNPLLEALRYGKVIITLDNGNTKDVIQDGVNGVLLPCDKPELIPHTVITLLNNAKAREQLSCNAKEYARRNLWTWEDRMNTEYEVVLHMMEEYE